MKTHPRSGRRFGVACNSIGWTTPRNPVPIGYIATKITPTMARKKTMNRVRTLLLLTALLFGVTAHRASAGGSQDTNNTGSSNGDESAWSHASSDDSAWSNAESSAWSLGSSNGSDGSEIGASSDDAGNDDGGIDGDGE
jgi:hypothetical protein